MRTKIIRDRLNVVFNPDSRFVWLNMNGFYKRLSDEECLKKLFNIMMGYELNLDNPRTFSEKLQWLKLHDRNPLYSTMVDKYEVKKYVSSIIGKEHIIPTLGVWNKFEDIDFNVLPDRFVLKCTHDSGGLVIVNEKRQLDIKKARYKINRNLHRNYYYFGREWPYRDVIPRIIAESYLDDGRGQLRDYKLLCFNGTCKLILVCDNRFSAGGITEDFFTVSWEHLKMKRAGIPNSKQVIEKPDELNEMIKLAESLAEGIPFLRIDFYIVKHKIYFGEITFYPASGFKKFEPNDWDLCLGSYIQLRK